MKHLIRLCPSSLALAAVISGNVAMGQQWGVNAPSRVQAIDTFKKSISANAAAQPNVVTAAEDGGVIHLSASPTQPITQSIAAKSAGGKTEIARQFLLDNGTLFHEDDPMIDFSLTREKQANGRTYVRLNQTYGGVPVFGAETVVQLSSSSNIESVGSDIMRMPSSVHANLLNLVPALSADQARAEALKNWQTRFPGVELKADEGKLYVYCPSVVGNDGPVRLTWKFEVRSEKGGIVGDAVFVDAHEGIIAMEYPLLHNALNRQIYDSGNTSAKPGTLVRSEGQGAHALQDVNLAYTYFGHTYQFYLNEHGRDSIDGAGYTLSATVRYCEPGEACPYANAFWDGSRMYFGDTYASADDVVAHELTHGVTDSESDLVYMNQSGAINESFSDLWGEWIDLTNGAGNDSASVKWQMGEDLPIGAIRDMKNPPSGINGNYPQPDRMNSPHWWTSSGDNGGVHINSGVGNKLAYLLTDGDTFNGKTVTGWGISKTADLFYEVQTNLITSSQNYYDLYLHLKQAAINLGYNQTDRDNLEAACQAVEINQPQTPPNLPDLTMKGGAFIVKKNKMKMTVEITNQGVSIGGKTTVDLWYSADGYTGTVIKTYKLPKLKPGKVKKLKLNDKDASRWYGGYLYVDIDPYNAVPEQLENNNQILLGPLYW